jgi:redox-sensing transcriptional repressor
MEKSDIPKNVVVRLPKYLQILNALVREGEGVISSISLGERLGVTAAQIRKDLSYFGGFGKQGSGYQIPRLIDEIQKILNVDRIWQIAIVGMGELGQALVNYHEFARHGLELVLAFDADPARFGTPVGTLTIKDIAEMKDEVAKLGIQIGILTVSMENAQDVANLMVASGIKAILNYAPVKLVLPKGVYVQDVDPIQPIQRMTFYL